MADQPLGQDAQELLSGAPAGAAPTDVTPGAAVGKTGQLETTPPAGYVPLAALSGEREAARKSRERMERMQASAELHGYQIGDDGTIYQPERRSYDQQPQYSPAVRKLADALGADPGDIMAAISETVAPMAEQYTAPIASGTAAMYKQILSERDPDYKIYGERIDYHLNGLPVGMRADQRALDAARRLAIADNLDAIVSARMERAQNPGRVVGRYVEGAQGTQREAVAPTLNPDVAEWGRQQGVSEEVLAKAAELKAQRERGQR